MSQKTKVIEHLFDKYWNEETGSLTKTLMSLSDGLLVGLSVQAKSR